MVSQVALGIKNIRDVGSIPGLGKVPGGRHDILFLPGESYVQRSLTSYNSWGSQRVRHRLK